MIVSVTILHAVLTFFCVILAVGIVLLFLFKLKHQRKQLLRQRMTQFLVEALSSDSQDQIRPYAVKYPKLVLRLLIEVAQGIQVNQQSHKALIQMICSTGVEKYYHDRLESAKGLKRMDAAMHLCSLPTVETQIALEKALNREGSWQVKLYLVNALVDIDSHESIPMIVDTLLGAPPWYRVKINRMLSAFGERFYAFLPSLLTRRESEITSLVVDFASQYPSELLRCYLKEKALSTVDESLSYRALQALGVFYHRELKAPEFLHHTDPVRRNIAIEALAQSANRGTLLLLLPLLADEDSSEYAVVSVSDILRQNPRLVQMVIDRFNEEQDSNKRKGIAKVLSNRIEYLLVRLLSQRNQQIHELIGAIIRLGKVNGIIGFLNKNQNIELENEILFILRSVICHDDVLRMEFCQYLNERLLKKLGLESQTIPILPRAHDSEREKQVVLRVFMGVLLFTVPLIYLIRYWQKLTQWSLYTHLTQFVLDFNYYLGYYAVVVNSTCLLLLLFSVLGVMQQSKYWHLKRAAFLFKPMILPSVSIIAPAYQEEETIIESANSLLNLNYPNYELIVVNDGSKDGTLNRLINYYDLEKIDVNVSHKLKTQPVNGIYVNKRLPRLVVVDKANGGKADALNVGINVSRKEYFCGIDADSLLEKDALLKLVSMVLDSPSEAVALGGNIFAVNGCTVDKGTITSMRIPSGFWARLQTMEYLRAFMAGRLGWAYLRSLLIISGAFGLFRKDRVIEVGGYLTSSERYKKDTVGEDMELVVRLRRHMHEIGVDCSIHYSYNANCWTEVPENLTILHRQRDRWQRGLIDILYFHRKLIFNPRYGRTGLFALPYFLVFEMFGPFLEIQGYVTVVLAVLLGIINVEVSLLLFLGSILMGIVVSIFSLVISVKDNDYFPWQDLVNLLMFAVLENFGIRQMISFWRVGGYLNSLKKTSSWGKMPRQGFQQSKAKDS